MTTIAAAEVVLILLAANLRPASTFRMTDPYLPGPPILFIVNVPLPAHLLSQLTTIPDTTIVQQTAA